MRLCWKEKEKDCCIDSSDHRINKKLGIPNISHHARNKCIASRMPLKFPKIFTVACQKIYPKVNYQANPWWGCLVQFQSPLMFSYWFQKCDTIGSNIVQVSYRYRNPCIRKELYGIGIKFLDLRYQTCYHWLILNNTEV